MYYTYTIMYYTTYTILYAYTILHVLYVLFTGQELFLLSTLYYIKIFLR